jgi:hypothetical protein
LDTVSEYVDREHEAGIRFGPFHRYWLLNQPHVPERIRRQLELAAKHPHLVGMPRQGFTAMDANDFPPTSFTAVTASATESNLWTPNIWSPIPANDMRAGKVYKVMFGGIFTSTATQGVLTFTARAGQSATPASNVLLGASNATAPPASLTAAPFMGEFTLGIRSLGLAASGATGVGHGFVHVQGAAAATGVDYVMGGTVATTLDNTAATGLIVSITISVASQSYTCQWVVMRSLN